jgi:DUF1009 family protein
MARIGLVAGEGKLPIFFADAAKIKGETVIAFGVRGMTDESLESHAQKMHWLNWGDLKKAMLLVATERIGKIVLLGKVRKDLLFKDAAKLDAEASSAIARIKDKKDYAVFKEVADLLAKFGIEIMDSTVYLKDLMPARGAISSRHPTKEESADIDYGFEIAGKLAGLDIGQAVAIKDRTVLAAEAVEGTDEMIRRAGQLSKQGFTLVKAARPGQDMRFDVPSIGPETLRTLIAAGGKVMALEQGRTFLMDRDEIKRIADESGVAVVVV